MAGSSHSNGYHFIINKIWQAATFLTSDPSQHSNKKDIFSESLSISDILGICSLEYFRFPYLLGDM